jgi:hypothetical protein
VLPNGAADQPRGRWRTRSPEHAPARSAVNLLSVAGVERMEPPGVPRLDRRDGRARRRIVRRNRAPAREWRSGSRRGQRSSWTGRGVYVLKVGFNHGSRDPACFGQLAFGSIP